MTGLGVQSGWPFMRQSISLGKLFGIDVRIHFTWLLAFAFVTWVLANSYYGLLVPRRAGPALPLLLGGLSALCLFASVLIHEFSHSLVAKARGLRVRDITLFIFGGVSNITDEMHTARDEFVIAAAGPLMSFALAAVFWLVGRALGAPPLLDFILGTGRGLRAMTPGIAVLTYLTTINLLLGVFNLVPAFPLDGGRVLRSIVWGITHRYHRATTIAATIGLGFGVLIVVLGVVRVVVYGDVFGGGWNALIGLFLAQAAATARQQSLPLPIKYPQPSTV